MMATKLGRFTLLADSDGDDHEDRIIIKKRAFALEFASLYKPPAWSVNRYQVLINEFVEKRYQILISWSKFGKLRLDCQKFVEKR